MKLTPLNVFIGLALIALLAVGVGLFARRRKDSPADTASFVNIAPLATLTTSSTHADGASTILRAVLPGSYGADKPAGYWEGWNDGTNSTFPDWVQLEWPTPVQLNQVTVVSLGGSLGQLPYAPGTGRAGGNLGLRDYLIQIWTGTDWQTVSTITGNDKDLVATSLPTPVTTQKLRVYITASQDGIWSRITQLQVQGKTL